MADLVSDIKFPITNCTNSIDTNCSLAGFINPLETACLQCKTGYYLVEKDCLDSCPAGYVPHEGTKSCQSNLSSRDFVLITFFRFRMSLWRLFCKPFITISLRIYSFN